jgi:hypothetical protein
MPTKFSSADVAMFLVGGFDLLGNSTVVGVTKEATVKDSTGLGMDWDEFTAISLKRGELTQDGYFDNADGKTHDAFVAGNGVSRVGMLALTGGALGDAFIGFQGALQTKYDRKVQVGELHGAQASYQVNGKIEEGVLVKVWEAITAAGNTEASDVHDVAAPTTGGSVYLEVSDLDLDAATNLVVKVRHSDDGVTWADLDTFTAVTARTAERRVIAGEIKDYVASSWAWTGTTGGSETATFAVGVCRDANN